MLDARVRPLLRPGLDAVARRIVDAGVTPMTVTLTGWGIGVGACVAAGFGVWWAALTGWLLNRLLDGVDGATARVAGPTDRGGYVDLVADFSIYAGFVVGVGIAEPSARVACLVLLLTYYVSGAAFLALSALLAQRDHHPGDDRSLHFVGGLAEGTETVIAYVVMAVLPAHAEVIAWAFAAAVAITAVQRVSIGVRLLGVGPTSRSAASAARERPA